MNRFSSPAVSDDATGIAALPHTTLSGGSLSRLGLGCSRIGSFNNPTPLAAIRELLRRSLDLGVNVFDTADVYGQGDSERELGRALAGRRDDAFIVTKVGKVFSARMNLLRPLKPVIKPVLRAIGRDAGAVTARRDGHLGQSFEPRYLQGAVESSLRRLRIEAVDGLLLHSPRAEAMQDPALRDLLARLRQAGKLRHFGASCDNYPALEAALRMEGLSLLELPMDLVDEAVRCGLDRQIRERGIAVLGREVIRLSPGLPPIDAVVRAAGRRELASTIVGTSRLAHLQQLVAAVAAAAAGAASARPA